MTKSVENISGSQKAQLIWGGSKGNIRNQNRTLQLLVKRELHRMHGVEIHTSKSTTSEREEQRGNLRPHWDYK